MSSLVDKIKNDIDTLVIASALHISTDFNKVGEFHSKFGLPVAGGRAPRELTKQEVEFRLRFLVEELCEIAEALGYDMAVDYHPIEGQRQDVPKAFDGLIDLVYVALGTAHMGGWPWQQGFEEVQRANMSKVRATSAEQSTRGSTLDVVKPEGFKPPNMIEVLMRAGWRGPRLPVDETQPPTCPVCESVKTGDVCPGCGFSEAVPLTPDNAPDHDATTPGFFKKDDR